MCMEACSAWNRCCPNALDRDIDSKVSCERRTSKNVRGRLSERGWDAAAAKGSLLFARFLEIKSFGTDVWGEAKGDVGRRGQKPKEDKRD